MSACFEYDIVGSPDIAAGKLNRYEVLIIASAPYIEMESLKQIDEFVKQGGMLIAGNLSPKAFGMTKVSLVKSVSAETIKLDGKWRFRLDEQKAGRTE